MDDSISEEMKVGKLYGCGAKRSQLLNRHGIHTVRHLITKSIDSKLTSGQELQQILKLRSDAKRLLFRCSRVGCHSWMGKTVHLMRSNSVRKVQVSHIVIQSHQITLEVCWLTKDGRKKKKNVSPLFLIMTHILWLNGDVVSDEEGEDSSEVTSVAQPQVNYGTHESIGTELWRLSPPGASMNEAQVKDQVEAAKLTVTELYALRTLMKSVNHMINSLLRPSGQ